MSQDTKPTKDTIDSIPQAARGQDVLIILLVIFAAVFFVINLLPQWLPALTSSATGNAPKV